MHSSQTLPHVGPTPSLFDWALFDQPIFQSNQPARGSSPGLVRKSAPVFDAGALFEQDEIVSPDRFLARYCSGATALYDAIGLTDAGKDIGIVADLVKPRILAQLRRSLKAGSHLFCDSGAYGAFKRWRAGKAPSPIQNFNTVFEVYDALLAGLPLHLRFRLALVAPDVVGDQEESLAVLRINRSEVLRYIAAGTNVIVPMHTSKSCNSVQAFTEICQILGTSDFSVGIPAAAAPMPLEQITALRHWRFHILGKSTLSLPLYKIAYAILHHNPDSFITCDSNRLRANLPAISVCHHNLVEENASGALSEGMFDATELVHEVLYGSNWMSVRCIEALLRFYGIEGKSQLRTWLNAHRQGESGLSALIEEINPEAMRLWSFGLHEVFGGAAIKALSARMRAQAVSKVIGMEAA